MPVEYVRIISLWGQNVQAGYGWAIVDTWQEYLTPDSIFYFTPMANGGVANIPFYTAKLSCPMSISGNKKVYVKSGLGFDPNTISGELLITKKIDGKDYSKRITFRDFKKAYDELELTNPTQGQWAAVEVHDFTDDARDVWIRIDFVKPFISRDTSPDINAISNITDTTADIEWNPRSGSSLDSGICYDESPTSASVQGETIRYGEDHVFESDPFITTLTGLAPLTTYTVRTFLINKQPMNYFLSQQLGLKDQNINHEGVGPYYGTQLTFTTTA